MSCPSCKGSECNACGKFTPKPKRMVKPRCMQCGEEIELTTGVCTGCGKQCLPPMPALG